MAESTKQSRMEFSESAADLQAELGIRKAQLHWLLQITRAISYNLSNEELLGIFEKVLREECRLSHYALFYFNKKWKCILQQPQSEATKVLTESILEHLNAEGLLKESFIKWQET